MATNIEDIIKTFPIARQRKIAKRADELMAEEMTRQKLRTHEKMQIKSAKKPKVA